MSGEFWISASDERGVLERQPRMSGERGVLERQPRMSSGTSASDEFSLG